MPPVVRQGQRLSGSFLLLNQGAAMAVPVQFTVYGINSSPLPDGLVGETVPLVRFTREMSLNAGTGQMISFSGRIPGGVPSGTYTLELIANSDHRLPEIDEDLGRQNAFGVTFAVSPAADLTVFFTGKAPLMLPVGTTRAVALRVTNIGRSVERGTVVVELIASTGPGLGYAGPVLAQETAAFRLGPGRSRHLVLRFLVPADVLLDPYLVAAIMPQVTPSDSVPDDDFAVLTLQSR